MVENGFMNQAKNNMTSVVWHKYNSRSEMVEGLANATEKALESAVAERGEASWAVSGGSTPAPLFTEMATRDLQWGKMQVALVDERWVNIDHPRSNEAFMLKALNTGTSKAARFLGMKTEHDNAQDAVAEVNEQYNMIAQPFDSILLGMGPDGHTASLFEGAKGIESAFYPECRNICTALTAIKSDVTGEEVERMSLTAAAIAKARHVVLMITGQEKLKVLEEALEPRSTLPIGRLARRKPFEVYWAP